MNRRAAFTSVLAGLGLLALIASPPACSSFDAAADNAGSDGGDASNPLIDGVPPGCDPTKEQNAQPACQNSDFAVFVAPTGTATGTGTQDDPVNTVTRALTLVGGKKQRIFVCEGTYDERVTLKAAVSIYGGLSCASKPWAPGKSAVIGKAGEAGYALDAVNVGGSFEVVDLEFVASNGDAAFPNSVAARFVGTAGATLRRVKLTAKNGFSGGAAAAGAAGSTVSPTDVGGVGIDPTGNAGTAGAPGSSKTCKCPNAPAAETTTGGSGGAATTGPGGKGAPTTLSPAPAPNNDGAGGADTAVDCSTGLGHKGAERAQATGGAVPTRLGALNANAWTPEPGATGANGLPGQGGGGGSGQSTGGGSGGGCGGCGGFGGTGGAGGGASIALLAIDSPIKFSGELATGTGGSGSDGGDGGNGGTGGFHGNVTSGNGCQGGDGGKGGKGGGGAGGAGGLSVGILFKGTAPTSDGATFTLGTAGLGGNGKSANNGPAGVKAPTASADTVGADAGI